MSIWTARPALTASRAPPRRPPGMRSRPRSRVLRTSGSRRTVAALTRRGMPGRFLRIRRISRPRCRCTTPVRAPGGCWRSTWTRPRRRRPPGGRARPAARAPGARWLADVSPSGGRHVFVLFAAALPWLELRDVARALALRFPAIDTAPMSSLGGQISPPGSRHKSGGWRVLSTPVDGRHGGRRAPERAGGMGRDAGRARGRAAPG